MGHFNQPPGGSWKQILSSVHSFFFGKVRIGGSRPDWGVSFDRFAVDHKLICYVHVYKTDTLVLSIPIACSNLRFILCVSCTRAGVIRRPPTEEAEEESCNWDPLGDFGVRTSGSPSIRSRRRSADQRARTDVGLGLKRQLARACISRVPP